MGCPCARSSDALRVSHPRRRAGGTELDHHFKETKELSESVRWIPRGKDRLLWPARNEETAQRRRDRTKPIEDRSHDLERKSVSRVARRNGKLRRLPLELRRRQANPESLASHGRRARAHSRVRRDEPRSAAARIQVRGLDNLLRADASDRYGQRSSRHMSATRGTRRRTSPQVKNSLPKTSASRVARTRAASWFQSPKEYSRPDL